MNWARRIKIRICEVGEVGVFRTPSELIRICPHPSPQFNYLFSRYGKDALLGVFNKRVTEAEIAEILHHEGITK